MIQKTNRTTDVYRSLYEKSRERSSNPDLYNPRLSFKGRVVSTIIYLTVLIVSFVHPVSGVVFYGFFREDRPAHAITGLVIFLANFIFAISSIIIDAFNYA